jgi:hypothetical protein
VSLEVLMRVIFPELLDIDNNLCLSCIIISFYGIKNSLNKKHQDGYANPVVTERRSQTQYSIGGSLVNLKCLSHSSTDHPLKKTQPLTVAAGSCSGLRAFSLTNSTTTQTPSLLHWGNSPCPPAPFSRLSVDNS